MQPLASISLPPPAGIFPLILATLSAFDRYIRFITGYARAVYYGSPANYQVILGHCPLLWSVRYELSEV